LAPSLGSLAGSGGTSSVLFAGTAHALNLRYAQESGLLQMMQMIQWPICPTGTPLWTVCSMP